MNLLFFGVALLVVCLVILLLLIVFAIFIPLNFNVFVEYKEVISLKSKIRLIKFLQINFDMVENKLDFLVGKYKLFSFPLRNSKAIDTTKKTKKNINSNEKKTKKKGSKRKKTLDERIQSCIKIVNAVKLNNLRAEGRYGTGDPYVTAMISVLSYSLQIVRFPIELNLEPDYENEVFDLEFYISGEVKTSKIMKILIKELL